MGAPHDPVTEPILEANLARLRGSQPDLAARILAADGPEAETVEGRGGARTLSWQGVLVASAYDPQGEGERLAAEVPAEADVILALGFGTGHHLGPLCAGQRRSLWILEPRLPLLHRALGLGALPFLGHPDVHLHDEAESFLTGIAGAYSPGMRLHVLVHPSLARSRPDEVRDLVARIARTKEIGDTNAATVRAGALAWSEATFQNGMHVLTEPSLDACLDVAKGIPAVVCAAGPSLDQQLPQLRAERSRLFVIAIGQSLRSLVRAGIHPDLVYVVENQDVTHQLRDVPTLDEQTLVLAPHAHPALYALPARHRVVALDASNPVGRWIGSLAGHQAAVNSGGSVALSAVWLAERLGASQIALLGQDLAFSGGRRYAADSPYGALEVEQDDDGEVYFTNLKVKARLFDRPTPDRELAPNTLWVEGWHGDRVLTDRSYAGFREAYRGVGRMLAARGCEVVNCTEGGAKISGLRHETFSDWLAAMPTADATAREELERRLSAHRPPALAPVRRGIAELVRALEATRRLAKRGRDQALALAARVGPTGSLPSGELRRLQKTERRLHRQLDELPIVVFQMQREIQDLTADTIKRGGSEELRLQRTAHLFEAVQQAADRVAPSLETLDRDARDTLTG